MLLTIPVGTTSKIIEFPIFDSSSAVGACLANLTYANAGTCYYDSEGSTGAANTITLVNMTKGVWTSNGFCPVDTTNMPGVYQLGLPNALLANGTWSTIYLDGAANAVPVIITMQMVAANSNPTYSTIRANMAFAGFQFMMSNSTTHAPQAGLGNAGANITVSRAIGANGFGALTSANQTEVGSGIYKVDFSAADLNGSAITLQATATGCDTTFVTIITSS